MFGHWSPVVATIIRWTPVEIAGQRGRSGPVKTDGDRRNPYLILVPTSTPGETLHISICQWPPRVTGGHRRPPVTFPAADAIRDGLPRAMCGTIEMFAGRENPQLIYLADMINIHSGVVHGPHAPILQVFEAVRTDIRIQNVVNKSDVVLPQFFELTWSSPALAWATISAGACNREEVALGIPFIRKLVETEPHLPQKSRVPLEREIPTLENDISAWYPVPRSLRASRVSPLGAQIDPSTDIGVRVGVSVSLNALHIPCDTGVRECCDSRAGQCPEASRGAWCGGLGWPVVCRLLPRSGAARSDAAHGGEKTDIITHVGPQMQAARVEWRETVWSDVFIGHLLVLKDFCNEFSDWDVYKGM
ncbi:hypothetical protein B0H11DRAFT_1924677 [Mycena galericulata]|nr:hypothetical protein B0H11DRAFT_1924677 [Mycena galericulata]